MALERSARTKKEAEAKKPTQAEKQADRNMAQLIEEEEREQAAQRKVRDCSTLTFAELHCTRFSRLDGVSIAHARVERIMTRTGRGSTALAPQGKQPMSKGKSKAGSSGAGGGPSTKAAAAAGSSEQGSSGQGSSSHGSSRPSAPPARIIGLNTEEDAVQAAPPLAAEAAVAAQQTEPEPAGGGSTKKEKERQRKERQRKRKVEEAWEAMQVAIELLLEGTAGAECVDAVKEAMHAAEKHETRSEKLPVAALLAEARTLIEQARAAEVERARMAAEEAASASAVEAAEEAEAAAELQQLDEEMAALGTRRQLASAGEAREQQRRASCRTRAAPRCGGDDAWCGRAHARTTSCCRAVICACVGRAPSCSGTAARCVAGPSTTSRRC
jgi:hypothetical protein